MSSRLFTLELLVYKSRCFDFVNRLKFRVPYLVSGFWVTESLLVSPVCFVGN